MKLTNVSRTTALFLAGFAATVVLAGSSTPVFALRGDIEPAPVLVKEVRPVTSSKADTHYEIFGVGGFDTVNPVCSDFQDLANAQLDLGVDALAEGDADAANAYAEDLEGTIDGALDMGCVVSEPA